MSVRVNQRWPDGLKERVEAKVGRSKVTEFTVEALEKALGPGLPAGPSGSVHSPAPSRAPSVDGDPWERLEKVKERFKEQAAELSKPAGRSCSRCGIPIKSPSLRRHDACGGGKVMPEPV